MLYTIGLDPAFRGCPGLGRRDPVAGSYGEIMRIFNISAGWWYIYILLIYGYHMVNIWLIMVNNNLVGGIPTPLKNMKVT